ncbi:lipase [Absidia repens]|uniref:Lipase n=1 Tax=Absidia repens TaxID=90262 RepID=A0A1X2IVP0_9FUNG|nr:lipase [Absidia repens]
MQLPKNFTPPTVATTFSEDDAGVIQASTEQIDTSVLRAQLAADSYCRKVVPGGKWDCPHCSSAVEDANIELTFTTAQDDTNGFIITSKSQEMIFLVFRGTNSIRSAVVDMKFIKKKYPSVGKGTEVHAGFYDSYVSVQEKVLTTMGQLFTKYPDYKIDITGHSLGAAQAVLGAMDLYQRNSHVTPSNTKLYTYGEPRVGNQDFAAYAKSTKIPKIRTVHAADMVPHLPPMSLGFVHSGDEHWIKDDKSNATEICSAEFESNACANSAVPFLSFLDHLTYYDINEGLCLK